MKKFILSIICVLSAAFAFAQNPLNNNADSILGNYEAVQGKDPFKVKVTRNGDGTYKFQITWVKNATDADGKKHLDKKNPDKSLRSVPCDQIVLINGLKYNQSIKKWDGAKIYDPQRGLRANAVAWFDDSGALLIKGSVMGISETVKWKKL